MAATPSDVRYGPLPSSSGSRREAHASTLAVRAACLILAMACVAAGLAIASAYPILPLLVLALFVAWIACAALRFSYVLPATIALVPVVGFAKWTGWLTFEEVDLLVLATAAGGYLAWALAPGGAHERPRRDRPGLSLVSWAIVGLFFASTVVALWRGIDAAGGLRLADFDWSAGYETPQNSIRIFKSFAFALLLAPLLVREWRRPGGFDRLGTGMTAALGLCALIVLQERLAFTGLLDFSDDYRVTGPFWEMHVGGAALDGFLALSFPFAVREALRHANGVRFAAAMGVLALAAYAALVTFSRATYAAVPFALIALFILVARQRMKLDRGGAVWVLFAKAIVFAMVVAVCGFVVFRAGGYRATLAAFMVLALAIPVDGALRRLDLRAGLVALVIAMTATIGSLLFAAVLPKGPYVVFALAFFATVAAIVHAERAMQRAPATFVVAGWLWMSACAVAVARHWGGPGAFHDSAMVLAGFVVVVFAASRLARSIWPQQRREQVVTVGIAGAVLATVAVFAAGAYMGGRFSASSDDLDYRVAHWRNGIERMNGSDWLFGKGLGRFPATSLLELATSARQGTYRMTRDASGAFMKLTAPNVHYLAFYELFRMSQAVAIRPHTHYVATIVARMGEGAGLHVEACERHLLYVGACVSADLGAQPSTTPGGTWREYDYAFDSGTLGDSVWWAHRPVVFALAAGSVADVRSIRLTGPDGVDLIENGNFRDRRTHWFSSSDRFHLPWHIKNLALDVLFDQGALGLAAFALLVGGALLRTSVGRAHRHPDAPFVAAAILGYLLVGVSDSLLDVPRGALLFYLVVLAGLALRNPHFEAAKKSVAPPAPAPALIDEAAARAQRRQQAFGTRKRVDA
jgi:hypothetical protein